jgi:nitrogen fixation NifU-like protein
MDLYSEIILDYFKNPRNKGPLPDAQHSATEHNPLCGDKITVHLEIDDQDKVINAHYEGEGCAISQASTSMLTEKLTGMTLEEVQKMPNDQIYDMLGIQISPGRVKCALLGLVAAKSATSKNNT